jgi:hypothetical protein
MAFAGVPGTEIPANPPNQPCRSVPGIGSGTAQYGGVWPNEWPNGRLHHDIARGGVAPVTFEPATRAPGGRASRCRRAQRTRSTAVADGVSSPVLDASLPGPWSQVLLGIRSRGRPAGAGETRARRSWRPRGLASRGRALALKSTRPPSETSSVAQATAPINGRRPGLRRPRRRPRRIR